MGVVTLGHLLQKLRDYFREPIVEKPVCPPKQVQQRLHVLLNLPQCFFESEPTRLYVDFTLQLFKSSAVMWRQKLPHVQHTFPYFDHFAQNVGFRKRLHLAVRALFSPSIKT